MVIRFIKAIVNAFTGKKEDGPHPLDGATKKAFVDTDAPYKLEPAPESLVASVKKKKPTEKTPTATKKAPPTKTKAPTSAKTPAKKKTK